MGRPLRELTDSSYCAIHNDYASIHDDSEGTILVRIVTDYKNGTAIVETPNGKTYTDELMTAFPLPSAVTLIPFLPCEWNRKLEQEIVDLMVWDD